LAIIVFSGKFIGKIFEKESKRKGDMLPYPPCS
jgi:hypothetical protein